MTPYKAVQGRLTHDQDKHDLGVQGMNHSIGDRVRIDCPSSFHHGKETVVTSGLIRGWCDTGEYVGYIVDIRPSDGMGSVAYEAHELIPIKYDGMELSTWDKCAFKPKEFVT